MSDLSRKRRHAAIQYLQALEAMHLARAEAAGTDNDDDDGAVPDRLAKERRRHKAEDDEIDKLQSAYQHYTDAERCHHLLAVLRDVDTFRTAGRVLEPPRTFIVERTPEYERHALNWVNKLASGTSAVGDDMALLDIKLTDIGTQLENVATAVIDVEKSIRELGSRKSQE